MTPHTKFHALLPILNQSCVTFKGPAWWIAPDLQFRSASEEEARLVSEQAPKGFHLPLDTGQKIMVLTSLPASSRQERSALHAQFVASVALAAQLAFAFAATQEPLVIPYAAILSTSGVRRLQALHQFETWGDTVLLRKRKYRIKSGITAAEVSALFSLARGAVASNTSLIIPFRRFCSAIVKTDPHDKLIDLTIALESFLPGGGEFRFRFPYFLSLLASSETQDREVAFLDLRLLYDARSALVHGTTDNDKSISQALGKWDRLLTLSRQCILYRMHFESAATGTTWNHHLSALSYGASPLV